ncbi:MAG: AIPR family protein [Armatimonadetes bacterium]|nr:AIPR family protein [Armatimonadota bacterium]
MADPIFEGAERHLWLINVLDMPVGLPMDTNPRKQKIEAAIYKGVARSLRNEDDSRPNSFHLKNKGITVLADSVSRVASHDGSEAYEVVFQDGRHGIVDGGHTYAIIQENLDDLRARGTQNGDEVALEQFVRVDILTGIDDEMVAQIAGGLNTAVQVQQSALAELDNKFDWLKRVLRGQPFERDIAYKGNEDREYTVREVLGILDLFNIDEFPVAEGKHPIRTCASEWRVLDSYLKDERRFSRMQSIVLEILQLRDIIASSIRDIRNQEGGRGGRLAWVKKAAGTRKFRYIFIGTESEYEPYKGALFPIISAFRCFVKLNPISDLYEWKVPFPQIVEFWTEIAPQLIQLTVETSDAVAKKPDAIAKAKWHWQTLASTVESAYLRKFGG